MDSKYDFTLLYDGNCPICRREIAWLKSRNQRGRLGLVDIQADNFDPSVYGTTFPTLMAEIHGLSRDGQLIKGMPVFYAAYSAVGLGWLMAPTRWPFLRPLFDSLYAWFASHRLQLGNLFSPNTCTKSNCGTSPYSKIPDPLSTVDK